MTTLDWREANEARKDWQCAQRYRRNEYDGWEWAQAEANARLRYTEIMARLAEVRADAAIAKETLR